MVNHQLRSSRIRKAGISSDPYNSGIWTYHAHSKDILVRQVIGQLAKQLRVRQPFLDPRSVDA